MKPTIVQLCIGCGLLSDPVYDACPHCGKGVFNRIEIVDESEYSISVIHSQEQPEPDYDIPSPREPGVLYGDEPDPDYG